MAHVSAKKLSARQAVFVREYLLSGNASDAYRKAGYSTKDADVSGPRLLGNAGVAAEIRNLTSQRFERLDLDADQLIDRLVRILLADPTKISAHRIGACRYCYGIGHEYQWKTEREYREALALATAALPASPSRIQKALLPSDIGGFGYRITADPTAHCPECSGLGVSYIVFADFDRLQENERLLLESVEQTKLGTRLHLADRHKALVILARHLGLFKESVAPRYPDGLSEMLMAAQGTTLKVGAARKLLE